MSFEYTIFITSYEVPDSSVETMLKLSVSRNFSKLFSKKSNSDVFLLPHRNKTDTQKHFLLLTLLIADRTY